MRVPYEGTTIDVLGPVELAVFKTVSDRSRDWADIEEMVRAEALDVSAVEEIIRDMLGPNDQRLAKLADAIQRTTRP
jgi:hypothetical protein